MGEWIDAAEAARRLGVKPATLYAYVSRGVLTRHRDAGGRRSRFDAAEIDQLARRGRPRRPPGAAEVVIESAVTRLGVDRPYYRGRDALELARAGGFEAVAEWLWTGEDGERTAWTADADRVRVASHAQAALPERVLPLDRLQVVVATLGATDPMRFQLDGPAVAATGRGLLAGMVEALPLLGPAPDGEQPTTAGRLWPRLCAHAPEPALLRVLDAALVLLADHELAASTLAARVAASVRADPYAVVAAGLGALGGPLHGGASFGAERMLAAMQDAGDAAAVIGERLRRGERIAGLGHAVYREGDGRGRVLLELLHEAVPGHPVLDAADTVVAEARARRLPEPNVDLALATFTRLAGMVDGAGEAVFAVARTAGWLAHAIEEYDRRSPLRLRARYTG
ncbi:MAG TPA: citrate/2-methylcitrate synthase [Streptosporangiales bacterium]